jgi:hypothetical protein
MTRSSTSNLNWVPTAKGLFMGIMLMVGVLIFALFGIKPAHAQILSTTSTSQPVPPPQPPVTNPRPIGLTTWSTLASSGIGQSATSGTGKLVTGEALSVGDESFKFTINANATGFQPGTNCEVNCTDGKTQITLTGMQLVGSGAQGRSTNNGSTAGGATSRSTIGSASMFHAGIGMSFVAPPKPTTPTTPTTP